MANLNVGEQVPDFELPAVVGNIKTQFKLSDYRGKKNVVLAFYPADWTPVCASQLPGLNTDLERFAGYDAEVVGISVDSIPSHTAWQKKEIGVLSFPSGQRLLSPRQRRQEIRRAARRRSHPGHHGAGHFRGWQRMANWHSPRFIPSDKCPATTKSSRCCASCSYIHTASGHHGRRSSPPGARRSGGNLFFRGCHPD